MRLLKNRDLIKTNEKFYLVDLGLRHIKLDSKYDSETLEEFVSLSFHHETFGWYSNF